MKAQELYQKRIEQFIKVFPKTSQGFLETLNGRPYKNTSFHPQYGAAERALRHIGWFYTLEGWSKKDALYKQDPDYIKFASGLEAENLKFLNDLGID